MLPETERTQPEADCAQDELFLDLLAEVTTWAPSSSTLISGPTEGILIDALLTFENADQIAGWAKRFGKKIAGVDTLWISARAEVARWA